ncbi:MAG: hypothetical protein Q7T57_08105, partial [Dehalococcoidales bacterium]|nr:hypothetical protein [Dehalococcoidales bacterium]
DIEYPKECDVNSSDYRWLVLPAVPDPDADEPAANANAAGATSSSLHSELTSLRVLSYGGCHSLLGVTTMSGVLALFDIDFPEEQPIVRRCRRQEWDDNSTWSIGATPNDARRPIIVTGTNAHYAFLWTLENLSTNSASCAAAASDDEGTPFVEAGHNIPSVDISSCGRFLAMSCIDGAVRVARIDYSSDSERATASASASSSSSPSATVIHSKTVDPQWGWSVRWIRPSSIRRSPVTLSQMVSHESHTPVPKHISALSPHHTQSRHNDALLEQMVELLMMQLRPNGVRMPDDAILRENFREHLREQMMNQQGEAGPLNAEDEEEEEEEDEDEVDEDEDYEVDLEEEVDADDMDDGGAAADADAIPALRDEDAMDAEDAEEDAASSVDEVRHDEMGWEAGFEPEQEIDESSEEQDEQTDATTVSSPAVASIPAAAAAAAAAPSASAAQSEPAAPAVASRGPANRRRASSFAPAAVPERPKEPMPSDFLIYTSKTNVYLLDAELNGECTFSDICFDV